MVPEGWRSGQVQDFFVLQRGFDLTQRTATEGTTPVYSSSGLAYYHNEPKVKGPGIVTGRKGSVGPVYLVEEDFWPHDTTLWVKDFKGNHINYVKYFMDYLRLDRLDEASSVPTLNRNNVHGVKCVFPPLPEQKRIAQILSTWDKAISTTEQLLVNSQVQRKALMRQLLTGKRRFPGFNEYWMKKKLGDYFVRVTRKNEGHSKNVVTISAQQGLVRQEDFFKKSIASEVLDGYFLLEKGQYAYNKSYSNGYPMGAIKRLNRYEDGVVTTLYICFEVSDPSTCDSDYFEHFFESGLMIKGLSQIAHEGGRAHGLLNVKPSDFFNLNILVPGLSEQQKIAKVLTASDIQIAGLQQKLDRLKLEKKALMQQLLTGKRRVKTEEEIAA